MAKYITILFLSVYLFTIVQVGELLKIPNMIEHYNDHQEHKPKIGFWEFVCIHYAHGEVNDEDFSKDMKLPFKSHGDNCQCNIVFYPATHSYTLATAIFPSTYKPENFNYTFSVSSHCRTAVWQPPQVS